MRILLIVVALMLGGCNPAFLQGLSQGLSGTYQMNQARQRQQWQEFNRQQALKRQAVAAERQAAALERIDMQKYGF